MTKKKKVYVTHICKNSKLPESHPDYCFTAFVDEDLTNAKSRCPSWHYCSACQAKGFISPKKPPKKKLSKKQKENLKNNSFKKGSNRKKLNEKNAQNEAKSMSDISTQGENV